MNVFRPLAALLVATGVFGYEAMPSSDIAKPVYMPEVLEQPAAPGELKYDEVIELECKSNSTRCAKRTRKHRPLRKVLKWIKR